MILMRKLINKLHKNNTGSSLVAALVAIAFIGILASVVATASVTNYKIKGMNYKSKKTFYSAESALEEVYNGLSEQCYTQLENAYVDTVTYLVGLDNVKANAAVKTRYLNNIRGLGGSCWNDKKLLMNYLNTFITDTDNAAVIDVNMNEISTETVPIIIPDVVIQYREKKTDDFSTVAVDLEINYPNVVFDFINDTNNLKSYLDFCLIGMEGITASTGSTSITGGAFAGKGYSGGIVNGSGFVVGKNANFTFKDSTAKLPTLLVAQNNVSVNGTLNVTGGSSIWTDNISVGYTKPDQGAGNLLYDDSNTYTYVSDDLSLEGNNSKVVLGKNYIGYGYGANNASTSSAIIVNGLNSTLDAGSVGALVLAGKSYISLEKNSVEYMTGDLVGIKGSQNIYLVPTSCMNTHNPVAATEASGAINVSALEKYFAYDLLDEESPYVAKYSNGTAYFYLNFKSDATRNAYVIRILNKQDKNGASLESDDDCVRLNRILTASAEKFVSSAGLRINTSADIKAAGSLYNVNGSSVNVTGQGYDFVANSSQLMGYINRSTALQLFLYDTGDKTQTGSKLTKGDFISIKNSDDTIDMHEITDTNIYDYVIDTEQLKQLKEESESQISVENGIVAAVLVPGDMTTYNISDLYAWEGSGNFTGGVILAYDCNIIVDRDFEGLIVTNGKIETRSGAGDIKANHELADKTIRGNSFLAKYFFAYQSMASDLSPENIKMEDLLSFENWRKNYEIIMEVKPAETETETE